jgi:hypothetical protein
MLQVQVRAVKKRLLSRVHFFVDMMCGQVKQFVL